MPDFPATDGGLSGFIATALWRVYCFFPSRGHWDWLLFFFCLALLVRGLYLPHLWNAVSADMGLLKTRKVEAANQDTWTFFWDIGSLSFLLWFFHTPAGQTFVNGRVIFTSLSLAGVSRITFWGSLVTVFLWFLLEYRLSEAVQSRNNAMKPTGPCEYPERNFDDGDGLSAHIPLRLLVLDADFSCAHADVCAHRDPYRRSADSFRLHPP